MVATTERLSVATIIILIGRCIPRVFLNRLRFGLHAVHIAREVVSHGEVECRRMELDVTPAKTRPAVSSAVDPPDEIEVIYILDCSEVRSLKKNKISLSSNTNA